MQNGPSIEVVKIQFEYNIILYERRYDFIASFLAMTLLRRLVQVGKVRKSVKTERLTPIV
jgi:hypothetical protein